MKPPPSDPEPLLLHDHFVRGLAHALVRDAHRAEDLAQETMLALARRGAVGAGPAGSVRAWLAAVVRKLAGKARRGDARRREREELSARAERVPSTAEILEREAARARVVEAVLALEEPYRSTLILRYFENLAPRAIAEQLGVPLETVRTRTKRGLEALRAELERRGGKDAWLGAVAPFLFLPPAVPLAPAAGLASGGALGSALAKSVLQVIAMSTKSKLAVGAVVLLLLAFWLLQALEPARTGQDGAVAADARVLTTAEGAVAAEPARETPHDAELARSAVTAPPAAASPAAAAELGALLVRMTWQTDGQPAAGVRARIQVSGAPSPRFEAREAVTGADGSFRVDGLRPGHAWVRFDRNLDEMPVIAAGKTTELAVAIPRGFDVEGRVVDREGNAVAGAWVWAGPLGDPDSAFPMLLSDRDGRFRIRSISEGSELLARSERFAPSLLEIVMAGEGATVPVELVLLRPGGSVEGRVLDPARSPVAGAVVLVGHFERRYLDEGKGLSGWAAGPQHLRTDADGRFRATGVEPGEVDVAVRARGFAVLRDRSMVPEGGTATFVAELVHGVTVTGRVVGAQDEPVKGAEVRTGRYGLLESHARTGADGAFELRELEPGAIELAVESEEWGRTTEMLVGRPDDVLACTIRLALGGTIRGRVLDERGDPLAGWEVTMQDEEEVAGAHDWGTVVADGDGAFALANVHDRGHRVEVSGPGSGYGSVILRGVHPAAAELVVRVPDARRPSVRIRGVLVGEDGKPTGAARLSPHCPAYPHGRILTPKEDAGTFDCGPYPPGEWSLNVEPAGHPAFCIGPRLLAPGETWDLGEVRIARGARLSVELARAPGTEAATPAFTLLHTGRRVFAEVELDGDHGTTRALAPGTYDLLVGGAGVASRILPFTIEGGVDTRLRVELRAGVECAITIEGPEVGDGALLLPRLSIRAADGTLVHRDVLWRWKPDEPARTRVWLVPGEYVCEAAALDGRRASVTLTVAGAESATGAAAAPETRLVLR